MRKAIVIGCHVSGFGVIRSLGQKNFRITALHYDRDADFAQVSRYVDEKAEVPHPGMREEEFIEFLLSNVPRWQGALILETNDDVAVALSRNREKLEKYYRVVTPDWNIFGQFIIKTKTYELAEKIGVSYPKTYVGGTFDEISEFRNEITYPCILKPVLGHEFARQFGTKLFKVNNFDELRCRYSLCRAANHNVMVQEIIPGPDSNLYNYHVYINSLGDVGARFLRVKVRQQPPHFGVTRVGVSRDRIPEIEEVAEQLLNAAGFRGFATVEFKKDPRDDRYKLLEVNARLIKSNWLPTYCGINFPWIIYKDVVDGEQVKISEYKKDAFWIELSEDIRSLVFGRKTENASLGDYFAPYQARFKTFGDVSSTDLMPFVKRVTNLARKSCRL